MKTSMKRLLVSLVGVGALMGTVLVTSITSSAPANAQAPDDFATISLTINSGTHAGPSDPIISAEIVNTGDCIGPATSFSTLGGGRAGNGGTVAIRTNELVGTQSFNCEYQLELSTNLPSCVIAVPVATGAAAPAEANASAPNSTGSIYRIALTGVTKASSTFTANADTGTFTGIPSNGTLTVNTTSCVVSAITNAPSSSIRYGNAEIGANADSIITFAPQGGGCGTEQRTAAAGSPTTRQQIGLQAGCSVYNVSAAHATASTQNCALGLLVYTVDATTDIPASSAGLTVRIGQNFSNLQESGDTAYEFVSAGGSNDRVIMFTTYLTDSCPQSGTVSVSISVGDNTAYASSPITITAAAAAGSTGCVIDGSKTLSVGTNGTSSSNFILTQKNTLNRPCSYTLTAPALSGALRLVSDPDIGLDSDDNPNAADASTPITQRDGSYTFTATRAGATLWFVYGVNNLNITISTVFPDSTVFTTQDNVEYQITVPAPCGRYPDIIRRALGGFGDFRSVQAYPGTTIVFDSSLASTAPGSLVSSTNQTQEPTFSLPPEVVVNGVAQPCAVEVLEAKTPAGCTVIGGTKKLETFTEGLTSYTFTFDHECAGAASSASGDRGFTG